MNERKISIVNGIDIVTVEENGNIYVPIKPICQAIGVAFASQFSKLKEDATLASVVMLSVTTGTDGKQYEMVCLPLMYVYGWLFTINPKNVKEEAQENIVNYRRECYETLYNHFTNSLKRQQERNDREIELLNSMNAALERKKEIDGEIRQLKSSLDSLRKDRLNPCPALF